MSVGNVKIQAVRYVDSRLNSESELICMDTEIVAGVDVVLFWIKANWFYLTFLGGLMYTVYRWAPTIKNTINVVNTIPDTIQDIQEDIKEMKDTQQKLSDEATIAEQKRQEGVLRTELLLMASKASLEALRDGEFDGNVTGALDALDEYMRKKASA